jgi:hypothetical protein
VVFAVSGHTGRSGFGHAVDVATVAGLRFGARLPVGPVAGKLTVTLDPG